MIQLMWGIHSSEIMGTGRTTAVTKGCGKKSGELLFNENSFSHTKWKSSSSLLYNKVQFEQHCALRNFFRGQISYVFFTILKGHREDN